MIKIMCALQTKNTSESDPQLQIKPPKLILVTITIHNYYISNQYSRTLIGYSSLGYPVLVYTRPVNSVLRVL